MELIILQIELLRGFI